MTACPRHGEKGVKHVGVEVNWNDGSVHVMHRCDGGGGFQRAHRWSEPARDEDAVLARVGLMRQPGWRPGYSFGNSKENPHQGYDHPKWKEADAKAEEPPYDPRGSYTCFVCGKSCGLYGHRGCKPSAPEAGRDD